MPSDAARLDPAFLTAATIAAELVRAPQVVERWTDPSVLPEMSVGALACHLGRQVVRVAELVPVATDLLLLDAADDHYARAAWVTSTSPADPVNERSQDDVDAAAGPSALDARVEEAFLRVEALLAGDGHGDGDGDGDRAGVRDGVGPVAQDRVGIPCQGWSLRRDHFLLTRLLEVVVHADDLACSVGLPTPAFPDAVFGPVSELLLRLAVRRHGQSAVISTLTRRERARASSAF